MKCLIRSILILASVVPTTFGWIQQSATRSLLYRSLEVERVPMSLYSSVEEKQVEKTPSPEETTEKFGLEAGVFQSLKQNDGESAKSLLKRYGIAYLATSIPLALISFAICYFLVDSGVDVAGLLKQIGIESSAGEKAGTFALAYAAHKAASPIRFPPTVILTPVVAKLIGKEPIEDKEL